MAAGLTAELEPARSRAGRIWRPDSSIGSLGTSASETPPLTYAGSTCATSFPTSVGIGSPASRPVFDIDFDGFANVGESFGTAIAVAQAPWKRRDADGRTAIGLLFQDHGVAQSRFPGPA